MDKSIEKYLRNKKKVIDAALDYSLPKANAYPSSIHRAMRYAVFSGGKRIRPALALAACEALGGKAKDALDAACAIECVHTYSLVHDDLPYCDDDDFRRGKPTLHRKYNPTIALLAGSALLTLGFELLANSKRKPALTARIMDVLSKSIGSFGMIGGQSVDLANKDKEPNLPTLQYIHTHKTGALITASVKAGAMCAGASKAQLERLTRYGEYLGSAFQIADDILDNDGYARMLGVKAAREEGERLISEAKKQLCHFGKIARPLLGIADYVLERKK